MSQRPRYLCSVTRDGSDRALRVIRGSPLRRLTVLAFPFLVVSLTCDNFAWFARIVKRLKNITMFKHCVFDKQVHDVHSHSDI